MATNNTETVILNARSIAKRERSIGHPEVAAIIEDLASQLSGVVGLQLAMDEALHWLALSNIDKADSILRAALNNTGGQSDGHI